MMITNGVDTRGWPMPKLIQPMPTPKHVNGKKAWKKRGKKASK